MWVIFRPISLIYMMNLSLQSRRPPGHTNVTVEHLKQVHAHPHVDACMRSLMVRMRAISDCDRLCSSQYIYTLTPSDRTTNPAYQKYIKSGHS